MRFPVGNALRGVPRFQVERNATEGIPYNFNLTPHAKNVKHRKSKGESKKDTP